MHMTPRDDEKLAILAMHQVRLKELFDQRDAILREITDTETRIRYWSMEDGHASPLSSTESYQGSWTVARKVEYILNTHKTMLSIRELVANIDEIERLDIGENDKKELSDKLSSTHKQKVDKGETFVRLFIRGYYFYGLQSWVKDGKIPQHYYKNKTPQLTL